MDTYHYPNSYQLHLNNKDKLYGHLLYVDKENVVFKQEGGSILEFPLSTVRSLRQGNNYRSMNGRMRTLLLTPTGFNLQKGVGEYRNIDYIFNSFSKGFTDNVSGTVGLLGIEPYFHLKVSHDFSPMLHVSAGGGISLLGTAGWHVAASLGTPDYFLNIGFMQNKGNCLLMKQT